MLVMAIPCAKTRRLQEPVVFAKAYKIQPSRDISEYSF